MRPISKKRSVTLVELIIALAILGVIIVALTSIDKFSRYHLIMAQRRSQLQNTVSNVLEQMTKVISQAIGDADNLVVKAYDDNKGIRIRIDDGLSPGVIDADDNWVAYRHENIGIPATSSEIRFYPAAGNMEIPAGSYDILANRIAITNIPSGIYGLKIDGNFDGFNWLHDNFLHISITACWDPSQAHDICGGADNPSVTMSTRITMPSVSIN